VFVAALAALALLAPPPPTTVRVWDDQLANDLTPAQVRFVATHEAGSQKLTRPQIAALKRVNPRFRVLQYRLGIGLGRHTQVVDGATWVNEWPSHVQEQWFFHVNGRREYMRQWGWYLTNPDDASWRRFFTTQLRRQIADTGAWGAFLDSSSVPNEFGGTAWSPPLPDYAPTFERQWSRRLDRWLPYVQHAIRRPVVANAGSWVTTRDATDYSHIAGVMVEGFGAGLAPADWRLQQRRAWSLARRGRIVIAQSYPASARDRLFDVASYLLVQGPQSYVNLQTSTQAEWWPEYDAAIGRPLAPAVYGTRVASRRFGDGTVYVNPNDAPATVAVNGNVAQFSGGGLVGADGSSDAQVTTTRVSQLTLQPRSAAIVIA
jgi:hypothetical protein